MRTQYQVDASGEQLMRAAMRQLQLSDQAHYQVLKLARTITHLAEALHYRSREAV